MISVKKSYDKICNEWAEIRSNTPINKCIADFAEQMNIGSTILDIGCGTGLPIDKYLSEKGFRVIGIDISAEMIKKAKNLNLKNVEFAEQDFLTFKTENRFDAIIAFDSLWHIGYIYQKSIFKKLSGLLKIGGRILFTSGKTNGEVIGKMFDTDFYYSALDKSEIMRLLKENRLKVIDFLENYTEPTTGNRDLLVTAVKY